MNTIVVSLENEDVITKEVPNDECDGPTWGSLVEKFLEALVDLRYQLPKSPKDCAGIMEESRFIVGDIYKCSVSFWTMFGKHKKRMYGDIVVKDGKLFFRTGSKQEYSLSRCSDFEFASEGYAKLINASSAK
jgi:hypothetical protein